MEIVLYVIGSILLAILCFAVFLFFIIGLKILVWFQFRTCKHCGNTLRYIGLKEGGSESYYLFHCEFFSVNTVGVHCIEGVGNADHPCYKGDIFPRPAFGVAAAVKAFVVRVGPD